MSEVAMVTGRDGKYSQTIKTQTRDQRYPTYSRPEHQQAAGMQEDELRRRDVIQPYLMWYRGPRPIRGEHLFILALYRATPFVSLA